MTDIINSLTQVEYERLLKEIAKTVRTQRCFVSVVKAERKDNSRVFYTVKRKGSYYPYLVTERTFPDGYKSYFFAGLII